MFTQRFTSFLHSLASRRVIFILLPVIIAITVLANSLFFTDIAKAESVIDVMPDISYTDKSNKEHKFDPSGNKLTALHFWATWCPPCVKELPEVSKTQEKYKGKGFKVIAISLDGKNVDKVEKFLKDNKIDNLDVFYDVYMKAFKALKIDALPTTIFIDKTGMIVLRKQSVVKWESEETTNLIEEYLDLKDI
ncbi:MAG: TlpA disulfide reductase family protein [Rickettsiales bacterium]